jgi:hypothetical protein
VPTDDQGEPELRGKQNICLDNIVRLAKALKINPAEFFELNGKKP